MAGPGAAGVITQAFGAVSGLLADAVTFLVATVCLLRIRAVEAKPEPAGRKLGAEIVAGLRFVARDSYLRVFTCQGAAAARRWGCAPRCG